MSTAASEPPVPPAPESRAPVRAVAPPKPAAPRRRRGAGLLAGFVLLVVAPFAVVSAYYLTVATDRYVSETKFTVRDSGSGEPAGLDIGLLLGTDAVARQDAHFVMEYIRSYDLLAKLDRQFGVREVYSDAAIDFWTRMDDDASNEDFLEYHRDMLEVGFDSDSSIITVKLQGFDPVLTQRMLSTILSESEALVNEISNQLAREQLAFINSEIETNLNRLKKAKSDLLAFQNEHKLVNPEEEAGLVASVIAEMSISLAEDQAELNALSTYLDDNAPEIVSLKSRIAAKTTQIEAERKRLAGSGSERLNIIMAGFEDLRFDVEFSAERYRLALLSLEKAQIDASQKVKSVVVVARPNHPDEALYPNQPYILATVGVFLLLFYGIAGVVYAAVREHMA